MSKGTLFRAAALLLALALLWWTAGKGGICRI